MPLEPANGVQFVVLLWVDLKPFTHIPAAQLAETGLIDRSGVAEIVTCIHTVYLSAYIAMDTHEHVSCCGLIEHMVPSCKRAQWMHTKDGSELCGDVCFQTC